MSLKPRNHLLDIDLPFNDFFHGFGRPALNTDSSNTLAGMRVDVHETDNQYEIHADLPGVKKRDISITLKDDILTVSASKNTESEKKEKGKVIWRERSSGSITRSFNVAAGTKPKDIKANFTDGELTLSVPRNNDDNAALERQRITIK